MTRGAPIPAGLAFLAILTVAASPMPLGGTIQEAPADTAELIGSYAALPDGASARKMEILDRLDEAGTEDALRFIAREMDRAEENAVRAHALILWASRHTPENVFEYLESRRKSASFGAYIPAIPRLREFDALAFLKSLYEDGSLTRYRTALFEAMAALDSAEAFAYLQEKWRESGNARQVHECFMTLLEMKGSRSVAFLDGLLAAEEPYARLAGARGLLASSPTLSLRRVEVFLRTETHAGVRAGVLEDLARIGSSGAARVLLVSAEWHPERSLHEIVTALASMPPDAVEEAAGDGWYSDTESRRFQVTALVLADFGKSGIVRRLDAADRSTDPVVRFIAAVARGRLVRSKERIQRIMTSGGDDARWSVLHAIECFRLRDEHVLSKLLSILDHSKEWEIQIKAAEVSGSLGLPEVLPHLERCLGNRKLLVRVAAARALGRVREKESVRILLERLGREKGRTAWEILRSLKSLTGRTYGIDAEQWESWWKESSEAFAIVTGPEERARSLIPADEPSSRYSFYGLPIDSHNIVFVADVSGSMAGPRFADPDGETPIARLRKELTRSISSLTSEHFINMIFFSDGVRMWRRDLVAMVDEAGGAKAEALTHARYLHAEGGTNLYGALMAAMEDEEADAIVLLSDGDPTVGRIVDKDTILEEVLKRNRLLQARIHVIAIGKADRVFLKRLALGTGGTFKSF